MESDYVCNVAYAVKIQFNMSFSILGKRAASGAECLYSSCFCRLFTVLKCCAVLCEIEYITRYKALSIADTKNICEFCSVLCGLPYICLFILHFMIFKVYCYCFFLRGMVKYKKKIRLLGGSLKIRFQITHLCPWAQREASDFLREPKTNALYQRKE